ncbi:CD209 antigen-like protein C [Chanos chanos]|uniref:CD209 antigen-like protein C n=1 Tax=Chanos chanos TaxID=29144 RepID=A0A6J2W5R2_CHACN|nr:CD209 antigen-like protein C [Chanos chanos]
MEDAENHTYKPALYTTQGKQVTLVVKRGAEYVRSRTTIFLLVALLASVCANIVLGVLLANRSVLSVGMQSEEVPSLQKELTRVRRDEKVSLDQAPAGNTSSPTNLTCTPCPEGWLYIDKKCYEFSEDKLDWYNSTDSCASKGGHLAILRTQKQHDSLQKEANAIGGFDYHYWIGLSEAETVGEWNWVDNTHVNKTFWSKWDKTYKHAHNATEKMCVVFNTNGESWHSVPCNYIYKRICEKDVVWMYRE